jgi:hypothetical protein
MTTPSNTTAAGANAAQDTRFFYIVSALLLLIIIMLGALWVVMRNRAVQAERQLNALQQQMAIQQAWGGGGGGMAEVLARLGAGQLPDALPGGTSTGPAIMQAKRVVHLPAASAEALGYRPGDVIVVDPPPAAGTRPHGTGARQQAASAPQD